MDFEDVGLDTFDIDFEIDNTVLKGTLVLIGVEFTRVDVCFDFFLFRFEFGASFSFQSRDFVLLLLGFLLSQLELEFAFGKTGFVFLEFLITDLQFFFSAVQFAFLLGRETMHK